MIHHAHQELPCSIVQCIERRTQHNALIRFVNGQKVDYNIGVFNPCLYRHPVKDVSVLGHGDDIPTLSTRTQIEEFKKDLSKHLLVKHIATLGPQPQLFDACEVRFLNRVIRWFVPPLGNCKGVNTPGSVRETVHAQVACTTRFHIIPFQCHVTRVFLFIEMNCSLQEIDGGTDNGRCGSTEEMPKQITCYSDSNFA